MFTKLTAAMCGFYLFKALQRRLLFKRTIMALTYSHYAIPTYNFHNQKPFEKGPLQIFQLITEIHSLYSLYWHTQSLLVVDYYFQFRKWNVNLYIVMH